MVTSQQAVARQNSICLPLPNLIPSLIPIFPGPYLAFITYHMQQKLGSDLGTNEANLYLLH